MKSKYWLVIFTLLLVSWVWQQWPDEKLRLVFCDVGQGDGAIVVLGSFQAIIDTGAYEDKMVGCISRSLPFWDREIEIVFISHADKDHVGALKGIISRYKVGKVIDSPKSGDLIRYGMLSFSILKGSDPVEEKMDARGSATNERSVVMKMAYRDFDALFTGDIDLGTELALVGQGVLSKIDVLKVPHHGSKYGSGTEFLSKLIPKWSVVSVGAKNSYGHPNGDALSRLDTIGSKVLRTDTMGTIEFVTDGEAVKIVTSR